MKQKILPSIMAKNQKELDLDFKKLKGFSILAGKYNHERVTNLDLHNLNNLHCDFIVQKNSNMKDYE